MGEIAYYPMKIVFLDTKTYGEVFEKSALEKLGQTETYPITTAFETLARCQDATIIITNKVVIDSKVIDSCPTLKLICVAATGTNNVDVEYAKTKGIQVKNITDYSTSSVAQLTFGLILQLINQTAYYDQYVKQGSYATNDNFTHLGKPYSEIAGKRFGIIGLGNIGRKVATIATAFGAEVVYHSLSGNNRQEPYQQVSLKELLQTSDIVSIHSPLTSESKNLINWSTLSLMKSTAILVNAGRGGIVVETDLAKALNENVIAGAGLDVFEKEPIEASNPLLSIVNNHKLVLSPHIAWASIESRTLALQKIYKNIEDFKAENNS